MTDIAAVTEDIQQRTHDDGFLWLSRNSNLHQTLDDFKDLSAAERNEVVSRLADNDLRELASDVNSKGAFGASGFSADEKRDLFNTLAAGLDGNQLGRLALAFDDRDDVMALGQAVANRASSDAKVEFIEEMAPRTADNDRASGVIFGGSWSELGDKEAEAITDVLGSMANDPRAFDRAIAALDDGALKAVAEAGINQRAYFTEAGTSVSHDPKQLTTLLDAAARSNDPAAKARVFDAGASAMQKMRDETRFPVTSVGTNDAVRGVTDKLSALMNTDVRGIVNELGANDEFGTALSAYHAELLRTDPEAGAERIGKQLAQLQGADTDAAPIEFFEQTAPDGNGGQAHLNARNLGYYVGAMRAGIDSLNTGTAEMAGLVKGIFSSVLSAVPTGKAGGTVGFASNQAIDAAADRIVADRTALGQALQDLAQPYLPDGARYRGDTLSIYQSEANNVRSK